MGPGVSRLGYLIAGLGGALIAWAFLELRGSFTPYPMPRPKGQLVESGPYRFMRHPMYVGALLFAIGGSLVLSGWALLLCGVLAAFFFLKARREEELLLERFSEYADYRRRTLF